MEKLFEMSKNELDRYNLLKQIELGVLKQVSAANLLGISDRRFRRLLKAYKEHGPSALISKRRGKPSNNRFSEVLKRKSLELIRSRYRGFGPSLVKEKLFEEHKIKVSHETVRRWMIENGLWKGRKRKSPKIHQSRTRRSQFGELIQMDGSPHDWFEGRRKKCCLLGFIDDATSQITHLKFVETESTQSYFLALEEYLKKHGRPLSCYCDRSSIFRVNQDEKCSKTRGLTQFGRALKELDIKLICANSPQAKGRIERLFKTLQDRLVKELTLKRISSIEEANIYLPEFIKKHNNKFSISASDPTNAHKELMSSQNLARILCYKTQRKLTKNLELSFEGRILQIQTDRASYAMRGAKVDIMESLSGEIRIEYKRMDLEYKELLVKDHQGKVLNRKNLNGGAIPLEGGWLPDVFP